MAARSIGEWIDVIGNADATNYEGDASAAARRILADLMGYRISDKHHANDVKELANAIQAYAKMINDAGITIVA